MTADLQTAAFGASCVVLLAGTPLTGPAATPLSVVVDKAASLPTVAVLRWSDAGAKVLSTPGLEIGAPVTVRLTVLDRETTLHDVFVGEVTALEYEFDGRGPVAQVRCSDTLHRLMRDRRTRRWEKVTDENVFREVLSGAGLRPGRMGTSTIVHDHVVQADVSDWDFLLGRARAAGLGLQLDQGLVDVLPRRRAGAPLLTLKVGAGLHRLRARVTGAGQVGRTEVRGWDDKTRNEVVATAGTRGDAAAVGVAQGQVARAFGPRTTVTVRREGTALLRSQAEVRVRAAALAAQVSDSFAELEGVAVGEPDLVPGVAVRIEGAGKVHDGQYLLTRVRHVLDEHGYRSHIECSGGADRTLLGLTGTTEARGNRRVPGVSIGVVTDVNDPDGRGRVKVKLPWLDDDYVTDWVRVASPGAGQSRGLYLTPEVNDEVVVAFVDGDVQLPFVLGALWGGRAAVPSVGPEPGSTGKVVTRALVSRNGHHVRLADQAPEDGIFLEAKQGQLKVVLDAKETVVSVDSKGGVTITGARDVSVTSHAKLLLEGRTGVVIKGARIDVEGTGPVSVTGAKVDIAGQALVNVQAAVIKLN